jgi:predicted transcriptional regulator
VTPQEFRDWRRRLGITQQQAADLLGYTKRGVAKIEGGDKDVARVVELACEALEARAARQNIAAAAAVLPEPQLG